MKKIRFIEHFDKIILRPIAFYPISHGVICDHAHHKYNDVLNNITINTVYPYDYH